MFYILRTVDVPFASTPAETIVVAVFSDPEKATSELTAARTLFPADSLEVVETLLETSGRMPSAIATLAGLKPFPGELLRAVETWNSIAPRCTPPLPMIVKPERFLTPYRRWKRRATGRTMLLEDIVQLVENATWTHAWIRLGWLFGEKDGEMNYEKLLHRPGERRVMTPGKRAAGNGSDYEAVER